MTEATYYIEAYTPVSGWVPNSLDLYVSRPGRITRRVLDQSYKWPYVLDIELPVAPVTTYVATAHMSSDALHMNQHLAAIWNTRV